MRVKSLHSIRVRDAARSCDRNSVRAWFTQLIGTVRQFGNDRLKDRTPRGVRIGAGAQPAKQVNDDVARRR